MWAVRVRHSVFCGLEREREYISICVCVLGDERDVAYSLQTLLYSTPACHDSRKKKEDERRHAWSLVEPSAAVMERSSRRKKIIFFSREPKSESNGITHMIMVFFQTKSDD